MPILALTELNLLFDMFLFDCIVLDFRRYTIEWENIFSILIYLHKNKSLLESNNSHSIYGLIEYSKLTYKEYTLCYEYNF